MLLAGNSHLYHRIKDQKGHPAYLEQVKLKHDLRLNGKCECIGGGNFTAQ